MDKKQIIFIISFILVFLFLPFLLKDKVVEFSKIKNIIDNKVNENFKKQDKNNIYKNTKINETLYEDYYSYISSSYMEVDEVTVFKEKNPENRKEIIRKLENYILDKRNVFVGYGPDQVKMLDNNILKEKGEYVVLIILDDGKNLYNKLDRLF